MAKAKAKEMMRVVVAACAGCWALALGGATASYAQGLRTLKRLRVRLKPARLQGASDEFKVPVEYLKLANGLRVVMSPDHTLRRLFAWASTTASGFPNRAAGSGPGSQHLFNEHMMFQAVARTWGRWSLHSTGADERRNFEWVDDVSTSRTILKCCPSNKLETAAVWLRRTAWADCAVTDANLKNQAGVWLGAK